MKKSTTTALSLSSSKVGLKKHKALLPDKPGSQKPAKEPVITGKEPASGKAALEESANNRQKPDQEINALVEQIKATGVLKNVFCNGFNFVLVRTKKSPLNADEKSMLEEPLNKIEVKLLEMLPEFIRKQADKGGPIIDLAAAVVMIIWAKNQEANALKGKEPAKPAEEPGKPPEEMKVHLN